MRRFRYCLPLLALLGLPGACAADTALFTFPLQFNSNLNDTYTVGGITLTCTTDPTPTAYDPAGNPAGVVQTTGQASYDPSDGGLAGAIRLSETTSGQAFAAGWLTFSSDVYQLDFYALQWIDNSSPFTITAYDPADAVVTSWQTQAASPLDAPAYEHMTWFGDTPIRRLRLVGGINMSSLDNLRVWTDAATPAVPESWGDLKRRFR